MRRRMSTIKRGRSRGNGERERLLALTVIFAISLSSCGETRLPGDEEAVKIAKSAFGVSGKAHCREEELIRVQRSEFYVETFWECKGESELLEVIVVVDSSGIAEVFRTNKEG